MSDFEGEPNKEGFCPACDEALKKVAKFIKADKSKESSKKEKSPKKGK